MAAYAAEILADDPWLYWRLNEQSGTAIADASGNARTGVTSGTPTLAQSGAIDTDPTDDAISFDATDDHVGGDSGILNSAAASVEVWFEYSGTPPGGEAHIAGCANGDGGSTFDRNLTMNTSGGVAFMVADPADKQTGFSSPLSAGWHHIVGTVPASGGNARCYVDGVQTGSVAADGSYTGYGVPNALVAGATAGPIGGTRIAGKRDEFALYDAELSPARVLAHYEAALAEEADLRQISSMSAVGW